MEFALLSLSAFCAFGVRPAGVGQGFASPIIVNATMRDVASTALLEEGEAAHP